MRRSRAALLAAAVRLVTERETTAITVSDLADAADLSRRAVYQQFPDKDAILLEAALDLARRARQERRERIGEGLQFARERLIAMGAHFAEHRRFYRAMLTGSCGYAFNQALCALFAPGNEEIIRRRYGDSLDPRTFEDLTAYLTGGTAAIVHTWVVDASDPLDPQELVDRLGRLLPLLLGPSSEPATPGPERPPRRPRAPRR